MSSRVAVFAFSDTVKLTGDWRSVLHWGGFAASLAFGRPGQISCSICIFYYFSFVVDLSKVHY